MTTACFFIGLVLGIVIGAIVTFTALLFHRSSNREKP